MKLGATITSERGKPVQKTGNEYLIFQINRNNKPAYDIYVDREKITVFEVNEQKEILREDNGSLKHGTCPECGSKMDEKYSCCSNNDCDYFA